MEKENKSDLLMAIESFEDEVQGVESYKHMVSVTKDPNLKKIFNDFKRAI